MPVPSTLKWPTRGESHGDEKKEDFPLQRRTRRVADLTASVTVFLIAVPLSLGIALTTGAPLQAGLVAAAVGGIVAGRLGGAPLQICGPAAGLTVVTAELIHTYGWRTTCAITVIAGLAQLALGQLRVARSALAVSPAIVHGMLAGIGVTIALAQLHIVLGGSPESSAIDNVLALPSQLANLHPVALAISAGTVTALLAWPRLRRSPGWVGLWANRIPAALAAVGLATAVAAVAGLQLPRVDLPSWSSHALPQLPNDPLLGLLAAVLTVMLVSSVQTLLTAVAMDKLAAQRADGDSLPAADLDRELRGLGTANMISGALGGLPVAGVAVRSSANISAGAVSRNSSILHGLWVVIAGCFAVVFLELIPLAALAALVMVVGVKMVNLTHLGTVTRHRETQVYAATVLGVVLLGVLEGVAIGVAVAVLMSLHRLARTRITSEDDQGTYWVRVRGQLTFLAVPRLSRVLSRVPNGATVVVDLEGSFMDHARSRHSRSGGRRRRPGAAASTSRDRRATASLSRPPATPARRGRHGAITSAPSRYRRTPSPRRTHTAVGSC